MLRKLITGGVVALAVSFAGAALAQKAQFGSADEAKAMFDKAVAAIKADKAKALAAFNKGEDGFKDRDLYPFCANLSDSIFTAHPALLGKPLKDLKDKTGFALGAEMMKAAVTEGKVSEVAYQWPRPGTDNPVPKVSYVTKVGDQVCGVGYYK